MTAITETILQGFTSARKQTQRKISLGLVFTLACFFYVVEPYFLYSSHQQAAVERRDQISDEVKKLKLQLRQTQAVNRKMQHALNMIHERIRDYPDHLNQDVLPQIRDHFYAADRYNPGYRDDPENDGSQEYQESQYGELQTGQAEQLVRLDDPPDDLADGPAGGPADDHGEHNGDRGLWNDVSGARDMVQSVRFGDPDVQVEVPGYITEFADAVNWYVRNWFRQIIDDLYGDIVEPIQQNELLADLDLFESGDGPSRLEALTNQAVEAVSGHLDTVDPDFWHSYEDGKVATVGELQGVIDRSFEPVTNRLDDIYMRISGSIESMQDSMDELEVESKEISASLDHLNDRIESMSTPFGAVPLRTTELIALFPVLIVLIMLFTALSLAKSARLYGELWQEYQFDGRKNTSGRRKQASPNEKEHLREFRLLTDCWFLPPWSSPVQPVLLVLYALAMAGIFIYSSFLIWVEPGVFRFPGMGEDTFRRSLFLTAYVAGFFVMAGTIWVGYKKLADVPLPKS